MYRQELSNISQRLCQFTGKDNVILCGFQGVGKTRLGKELAEDLSWQFVDTDAFLDISWYKTLGEKEFRRREEMVVASLRGVHCSVIATGGGAPLSLSNRLILKKLGVVIYLSCSEEELVSSLMKRKPFPSYLDVENPEASIRQLFREREPIYREFSDEQK